MPISIPVRPKQFRTRTYTDKVLALHPGNLLGYWPGFTPSAVAKDSGQNHYNATASALPLLLGTANKSYWTFGSSALVNLTNSGILNSLNTAQGGFIVDCKPSSAALWTDATHSYRLVHFLGSTVNDSVTIRHDPTINMLTFRRFGNSNGISYNSNTLNDANRHVLGISWNINAPFLTGYIDGTPNAANSGTVYSPWVSTPQTGVVGAYDTGATENWDGWIYNVVIFLNGFVPSDANHATIATKLTAGTLTTTDLNTIAGSGNWAWYQLNDTDSQDLSANVNGGRTGGLTTTTGIGDGGLAYVFDGSTSYLNLYSPFLKSTWSGHPFTVMAWAYYLATTWSDANKRVILTLLVDSNNFATIYKGASPNQNKLAWQYDAGGTLKTVISAAQSSTGWVHVVMTTSAGNGMKAYLNGAQVSTAQTGLGTWAGSLISTQTVAGCNVWSPATQVHLGNLAHVALWNTELTAAEAATLAVPTT